MTKKHTPLPWKVYYAKNNGEVVLGTGEADGCAIQAHNGGFWRDDDEAKANAEFVVMACNAHYDLNDRLNNMTAVADAFLEDVIKEVTTQGPGFTRENLMCLPVFNKLEKAIKAEKEKAA